MAMDNYQINLSFTADTKQAKAQLRDLQSTLSNIINAPANLGGNMTEEIREASNAAVELKMHLQNATNVKTGNLDFTKLNQSLKQSGVSLSSYAQKLQAMGPQGQKAFMQLTSSVAQAEVPLRRSNEMLTKMGQTLKNTIRWQISASLIQGFTSSISNAYKYAQDLNKSLNNIRIVSGLSADEMSKFAAQANKAAQALNTSTTAYTNAALIFYQQGLEGQAVLDRADTVVKLANVTGQSAKVVSDQMTAVWNNFYDGSKSIEYYADVLTALGAATASSTDEISQGLEKFAAVADTVGLSYEYATAALATVTAQTRQSADVVGTAFKTLFARIQDLELGETLDDGTTLGSYSEALAKVGVNIKEADGSLKDMNDILDEMGAKWEQIDKDQQVALAKSVAGIRQYTQLIALMSNWDFFKENLKTAENATGTLQKQADIYAESWEAASKRVKASAKALYQSLLKDDFFIALTDSFGSMLKGIGAITKGMGGLKGVLSAVGVLVTRLYGQQMADAFKKMAYSIKMSTAAGKQAVIDAKTKEMQSLQSLIKIPDSGSIEEKKQAEMYQKQIEAQISMSENAERLTEMEKERLKILMDQGSEIQKTATNYAKEADQQAQKRSDAAFNILKNSGENNYKAITTMSTSQAVKDEIDNYTKVNKVLLAYQQNKEAGTAAAEKFGKALESLGSKFTNIITELDEATWGTDEYNVGLRKLSEKLNKIPSNKAKTALEDLKRETGATDEVIKRIIQDTEEYFQALYKNKLATSQASDATKLYGDKMEEIIEKAKKAKGAQKDWANGIVSFASTLSSVGMTLSSIQGLMDTISDPDVTGWEKLTSILTSLSFVLMGMGPIISSVVTAFNALTSGKAKAAIVTGVNALATSIEEKQQKKLNKTISNGDVAREDQTSDKKEEAAARAANVTAMKAEERIEKRKLKTPEGGRKYGYFDKVTGKRVQGSNNSISKALRKGKANTLTLEGGEKVTDIAGSATNEIKPSFGKNLGTGLKHGLKTAGPLLIVAASVATAGLIINAAVDSFNKDANKAKEAAEMATEAKKHYTEVQAEYDEFETNLNNYKEAANALKNLEKGTNEYQKALLNANNTALELINTYKNLEYETKDGLIVIDPDSMQKVQEQQLNSLRSAQQSSLYAQNYATQTQNQADKTKFNRTYTESKANFDDDDAAWVGGGAGAGVALAAGGAALYWGLAASNFWNPVGIAMMIVGGIAAAIGVAGAAISNDAEEREDRALNILTQEYKKSGEAALTPDAIQGALAQKGITDPDLINSLSENSTELQELIKSLATNEEAIRAQTAAILGEQYEKVGLYMVGAQKETYNKHLADVNKEQDNVNRTEDYGDDNDVTPLLDEFTLALGKEIGEIDWDYNVAEGGDKNRKYAYWENGKKLYYTRNDVNSAIAQYRTDQDLKKLEPELEKLVNRFEKNVDASNSTIDEAFNTLVSSSAGTGFGGKLTEADLQLLEQQAFLNGERNVEAYTKYLENLYGIDITEIAKMQGYVDDDGNIQTDVYLDAMFDAIEKERGDFKALTSGMSEEQRKIYESTFSQEELSKMTIGAQRTMVDLFFKAFSTGGTVGAEALGEMFSDLTAEEMTKLSTELANVNWEEITISELQGILTSLGLETEITSAELSNFISLMKQGTVDLDQFSQNMSQLSKILTNIKPGDTISAEEYDKLAEYGLENYFMRMWDGTYKLTSAATDFKAALEGIIINKLEDSVKDNEKIILEAQQQIKWGKNLKGLQSSENDFIPDTTNYTYYFDKGQGKQKFTGDYYQLKYTGRQDSTTYREDSTGQTKTVTSFRLYDLDKNFQKSYSTSDLKRVSDDMVNDIEFRDTSSNERMWVFTYDYVDSDNHIWRVPSDRTNNKANVYERVEVDLNDSKRVSDISENIASDDLYQNLSKKVQFIEIMNGKVEQSWKDMLDGTKNITTELISAIDAAYNTAEATYDNNLKRKLPATVALLMQNYQGLVSSKETIEELNELQEKYGKDNEIFMAAYEQQAQALFEARQYQDFDTEEIDEYANSLEELGIITTQVEGQADNLAVSIKRLDKGLQDLSENFDDWKEAVVSGTPGSIKQVEAINGMKTAIADLLGITEEFISSDFVQDTNTLNLLEKAVQGDTEAIEELGQAASKEIILKVTGNNISSELETMITDFENSIPELKLGIDITSDNFIRKAQAIVDAAQMTAAEANAYFRTIGLTPVFETKEIDVAKEVSVTTKHVEKRNSKTTTDENGNPIETYDIVETANTVTTPEPGGTFVVSGVGSVENPPEIEVKQTKEEAQSTAKSATYTTESSEHVTNKITGFVSSDKSQMGNLSNLGDVTGDDDIEKAEKIDKIKKEDVIERYKEINDQLDDLADALDKASSQADRLWGKDRLAMMKQQSLLMEKEVEMLNKRKDQTKENLEADKQALIELGKEKGFDFQFDDMGNIINEEEIMTRLWEIQNEAIDVANSYGTKDAQDKYKESTLEPIQDYTDKMKDAISLYSNTREELEDIESEIREKLYAWQDMNFESLNYTLEIRLELNDDELKWIDYRIGELQDDVFKRNEAFGIVIGEKVNNVLDRGDIYGDFYGSMKEAGWENIPDDIGSLTAEDLTTIYNSGSVSQADFVEGLNTSMDNMYDFLASAQELEDFMETYYSDTLDMTAEELGKITTKFERLTSALEHYQSILELTGRSQDYKAIGKILNASVETNINATKVAAQNYAFYADEVAYWQEQLRLDPNDENVKQNLEAAENYMAEYHDALLTSYETTLEALNAELDNKLAEADRMLERTFSGSYGSFAFLDSAFERAAASQEEFLTSTNKIYETTKMIRNIQKEIDKTTSNIAKQRLKQFQTETQMLQNQEKLSKFELDIQQKKYDLLLAELALEEAKNAVSTVTLRRDAEGNFGYVYTADQDKIADAEQKYDDTQNALYNAELDAANDYSQKVKDLLASAQSELSELNNQLREGLITEAEYYTERERIIAYYQEQLGTYVDLYNLAISDGVLGQQVLTDAWSTGLLNINQINQDFAKSIETYLGQVDGAFETLGDKINEVTEAIKDISDIDLSLDTTQIDSDLQKIITKSTEVYDELTKEDGILEALKDSTTEVSNQYQEWKNVKGEIQLAKQEAEKFVEEIIKAKRELGIDENTIGQVAEMTQENYSGDYINIGENHGSIGPQTFYNNTSGNNGNNDNKEITTMQLGVRQGNYGHEIYDKNTGQVFDMQKPVKQNDISTIVRLAVKTYNLEHNTDYSIYEFLKQTGSLAWLSNWTKQNQASLDLEQPEINFANLFTYDTETTSYQLTYRDFVSLYGEPLLETILEIAAGFDTGGYTGSWGPEGKIAMVHEKELILNPEDTINFLEALDLSNQMLTSIERLAGAMSLENRLNQLNSVFDKITSMTDKLEQNIHIEASFPGVTDRYEVEEALNNIINTAAQYAFRD